MSYDSAPMPISTTGRSYYAPFASFAVTCFVLTLFTDLAYWATASVLWETMSVWLLAVGLLVGALAFLAGIVDLFRSRRARGLGRPWLVVVGQVVAYAGSIVNVLVHSRDGYTAVVPEGLLLSLLVVIVLAVTTFMGGPMAARKRTGAQI